MKSVWRKGWSDGGCLNCTCTNAFFILIRCNLKHIKRVPISLWKNGVHKKQTRTLFLYPSSVGKSKAPRLQRKQKKKRSIFYGFFTRIAFRLCSSLVQSNGLRSPCPPFCLFTKTKLSPFFVSENRERRKKKTFFPNLSTPKIMGCKIIGRLPLLLMGVEDRERCLACDPKEPTRVWGNGLENKFGWSKRMREWWEISYV